MYQVAFPSKLEWTWYTVVFLNIYCWCGWIGETFIPGSLFLRICSKEVPPIRNNGRCHFNRQNPTCSSLFLTAPTRSISDALGWQFCFEMFCHGPHENITCVANECLHWWSISPVVTCFPPLGSATVAHHSSGGTDREAVQLNTVPNVQPRASVTKCDREVVSWSVFFHTSHSWSAKTIRCKRVHAIESVHMEATKKKTRQHHCVSQEILSGADSLA